MKLNHMDNTRYKELYGTKPKSQLGQPSESAEQIALFRWAAFAACMYPEFELLYHIPNGGMRNKAVASKLKAEGVKSGVPDVHLPVARGKYHSLYIEMKSASGVASANQKEWISRLNEQGHLALVCCSFEDAQSVLLNYLKSGKR